jgi:lambda repressor-like predicted transcriptional regulator
LNDVASAHPRHPADVPAALKTRGKTRVGLSVANGYHLTAAGGALKRRSPALEAIIVGELESPPAQIWRRRSAAYT